jgi:FKBP-type peptidyl-prolyl cis-trans isomerase SlyD
MTIAGELIDKLDIPSLEFVERHPYVPETVEEASEATEAPAEDEEAEAEEE